MHETVTGAQMDDGLQHVLTMQASSGRQSALAAQGRAPAHGTDVEQKRAPDASHATRSLMPKRGQHWLYDEASPH